MVLHVYALLVQIQLHLQLVQLSSQKSVTWYWAMDWGTGTSALEHDDWRYDVVVLVIFSLLYV